MGFVGVASRIGAVSAPFVVELKRIHPTLPFGLMGGLAVIAALLCLILPETRGVPTAEVYDNANGKLYQVFFTFLNHQPALFLANLTANQPKAPKDKIP